MKITRLVTPFNAKSTATEVVAGIDLRARRAIVTGGALRHVFSSNNV